LRPIFERTASRRFESIRLAATLFITAVIVFGVAAAVSLRTPIDPRIDDQGAYLQLAQEIHDDGGVTALLRSLRSGTFAEDNRHPLYPALLAMRPNETFGRGLSLTIAVIAGIVSTWLVARRFSLFTASLFALLLAANRSFVGYSTSIVCESAMLLWGSLAYFTLMSPARFTATRTIAWIDASSTQAVSPARVLLASVLLGLMYLTKATGLLFFAVLIVWLAFRKRAVNNNDSHAPGRSRKLFLLAVAVAAFFVVASPLIERNLRRFGDPFHNINSLLLFADNYDEFESMLSTHITTGEAAQQYFSSHNLSQIVSREVSGLAWEAFIMLRSLGPVGLDDARLLIGIPLAVCALISLVGDPRNAPSLLLLWLFASWLVFAWYVPIAAGDRFAFPLLAPVLAHAADGIARLTSPGDHLGTVS
jgi:hypothetical protein